MKLTVKTLKQETFQVEVMETETVLYLKKELEKVSDKQLAAEQMTLIYAGLIMENDKLLSSYNIDEKKFLVVMIKPLQNDVEPSVTDMDESQNSIAEDAISPEQVERAIQSVVNEMGGYPEDLVRRAFQASYNNTDRAVEYLLNGFPLSDELDDLETASNPTDQTQQQIEEIPLVNANNPTPLAFLRNNQRFYQMRLLIRQNPELLDSLILEIANTSVTLLNLIIENQEEFLNIINEPIEFENDDGDNIQTSSAQNEELPEILISQQDKEAIDRLKSLGFPEMRCVEAYFACDKNEELAANFLCTQLIDE